MARMKVLVLGGLGSIGSRYMLILKHMGVACESWDMADPHGYASELTDLEFTHAIVATPTRTHYMYTRKLIEMGIPTLCEKPLSTSIDECEYLVGYAGERGASAHVVCNYNYTLAGKLSSPHIEYDYYKTGSDGLYWDCCQLLYLDQFASLRNESPWWQFVVNGYEVAYRDLEISYVKMLQDWLGPQKKLWTLKDGTNMTYTVLRRLEREGFDWDSGQVQK